MYFYSDSTIPPSLNTYRYTNFVRPVTATDEIRVACRKGVIMVPCLRALVDYSRPVAVMS